MALSIVFTEFMGVIMLLGPSELDGLLATS